MKRTSLLFAALAVALFWTGPASSEEPTAASDHVLIRIDERELRPQTARIAKGGAIAWINYARFKAEVRFPAEVASKLTCPDRAHWSKNEKGQIVSVPPEIVL